MPFTAEYLQVAFGGGKAGLGTVGYALLKDDGTVSVARTTTGVVEESGGIYGVADVTIPDDAYSVLWDTGGGSPVYAGEDLEPMRLREITEAVVVLALDATVSSRAQPGDEMDLVDDAITAAKHDESTAFPVKSADSGPSQIARTGADGDTLETLSDQIDGVAVPGSEMGLVDDAIRAAKYDETTAFPVKSDDSGSSQIARTGADGDTLETLSDQVDLTALEANVEAHVQAAMTAQGYTTARGPMIELAKKMLINRLELADGSTDNWILYDDDDSTPLLTFSVTNKSGGAVDLPSVAPARRTRGI
jgi:hypothetical protein